MILRFIFLFTALAAACIAQPPPVKSAKPTGEKEVVTKSAMMGAVKDGTYSNDFFGFSVPIPASYTVIQQEEAELLSGAGVDMLKNDNAAKTKVLEDTITNQAVLLAIAGKAFGAPDNYAFEIAVRKQVSGVTARMALAASVGMMTSTGKFKLVKSLDRPTFGGAVFAGAIVSGELNSVKLSQEIYIIIRRGYSVLVALTYSTDEGRKSVLEVFEKSEFAKR